MKTNWILINGTQKTECTSFPYAFRTAHTIVRKTFEQHPQNGPATMAKLFIQGPMNARGERTTYSYNDAKQLAEGMGLLNEDQINGKEFKRRR